MATGSQARQREHRLLRALRRNVQVERVRHDASIQDHPGDPGLRSAVADPADRGPGEGERGPITRNRRYRGGPLAVRMVPIALQPSCGIADGRIGLLAADSRVITSNASTTTVALTAAGSRRPV